MCLPLSLCWLPLIWIIIPGQFLSISDDPVQFEEPENLTVLNGSQVILKCRVYLSEKYQIETVQWIKDGFGFTNESLEKMYHHRIMMTSSNMKGHYDLVISTSNVTDDGEYACQASIKYRIDHFKVNIMRKKSGNIWLKIIVQPNELKMKTKKQSQMYEIPMNKQADNSLTEELKSYAHIKNVVWVSNNLVTSVACYTEASHPFARIEWKFNNRKLSQPTTFRNEQSHYEEIQSKDIKGEIQNSHFQSFQDYMYLSVSFLKFSLKTETNTSNSLECFISNFQDFLMASTLVYRVSVQQLFVKNIRIETIPTVKIQNLSNDDLVRFACYATFSENSRIFYKWSLVTNHFIKPLHEKSEIEYVDLKIQKEMNQVRLRCTVLIKPNVICTSTSTSRMNSDIGNTPDCAVLPVTIASKEIELSISYPPSIEDLQSNITIATHLRKSIHLSCIATGNPKPKIYWFKIVSGKQDILLTRQPSFILQMSTHNDYGEYQCHALSPGFDRAVKRVIVGTPGPPKIYGSPKIFSELLKPIKLTCTIRSIPAPSPKQIIWTRNYKIVDVPDRIMTKMEWIPGGVIMTLIIVAVSYEDFGVYNCSVFTEYGSDYFSITLYQTENLSMLLCVAIAIVLAIFAVIVCIVIYAIKLKNTRQKIKFLQIQTFSGYKSEIQFKETFRNDQFYLSPYDTLKSKSGRNALEPFIENVNKKENTLQALYNL